MNIARDEKYESLGAYFEIRTEVLETIIGIDEMVSFDNG